MPTPIFVCGAECGLAATGTASAGTEHWSAVNGTPTVVTSGPASMRSTRAFRCNPTASQHYLTHTFASAIASPATFVARAYVYFATLPSADTPLIGPSASFIGGALFSQSDSKIYAGETTTPGKGATGVSVTTGQWYRVDLKYVQNTTVTIDVQVDGTVCGQYTVASAASSITACRIGLQNTSTADVYIDDVIVSGTSGDYPIGAGTVVGQYPSADGTHGGGWASGTFGKGTSGGTNAANTDTDIWQSLDNPLVSTAADSWVANKTATALSNYVEFRNGTMPADTSSINGAMLVMTSHSASATTNNFNFDINDNAGHTATLMSVVDLSESTITIPCVIRNTDANGVAWTKTTMDANRNRFSGTDSNPDCYLDGFVWEVDYVQTATTALTGKGAIAVGGSGSLTLSAALSGRGAVAVGGTGSPQIAAALSGHGDIAVGGRGATQILAALSGHGDVAVGAGGTLTITQTGNTITLSGSGAVAVAAGAALQLQVSLSGHGDVAVAASGIPSISLYLSGHSDIAVTGRAAMQLLASLSGHGDVSTYGIASITVTSTGQVVVIVVNKYALGTRHMGLRSHGIRKDRDS